MKRFCSMLLGLAMGAVPLTGVAAQSQDYPTEPIKLIIPFGPGGGTDAVAVLFQDELSRKLGQPVVKENHPGSNSIIGTKILADADPDGHTLLLVTGGYASNPFLYANLPYTVPDDFAAVSILTSYPFVLGVRADLPFKSVKELIDYSVENPGELTGATSGRGASAHLTLAQLNKLSGGDIRPIPFKGAGPGLNAVAGGFVDVIFSSAETLRPFVESGKIKYFGSSGRPLPDLDIPSVADAVPGFEYVNYIAMLAPAGTPPEVLNKIQGALKEVFDTDRVKDRLAALNTDIIVNTPVEADAYIKEQMAGAKELIESIGLKPE